MARIENTVADLAARMTEMMRGNGGNGANRNGGNNVNRNGDNGGDVDANDNEDIPEEDPLDNNMRQVKMKLPSFSGSLDADAYFKWESKLEQIFECNNYSDAKKFKLAQLEFTGYAMIWLRQLNFARQCSRENEIRTWKELKREMKRHFVSPSYYTEQYRQLQTCKQMERSVAVERKKELVAAKKEWIVSRREEELKTEEGESVVKVVAPEFVDEHDIVVGDVVHLDARVVGGYVARDVEDELHSASSESVVGVTEVPVVEEHVDAIVQVASIEEPVESSDEHTEVPDTPSEVPDLSLQVVLGGKPAHHFVDPFAACVDAAPILHCSSYIAVTPCFVHSFVRPQFCSSVSLLQHMSSFSHQVDLRFSLRRIFDPGIALMFFVGCSGLVSDADFYDVLLIRGRILSNREGMM